MKTPMIEYKGHVLHAYHEQVFPTYHDPYASGAKRFSAVVRIDTVPFAAEEGRRYDVAVDGVAPDTALAATDLAMRYGREIIDGRIDPVALHH